MLSRGEGCATSRRLMTWPMGRQRRVAKHEAAHVHGAMEGAPRARTVGGVRCRLASHCARHEVHVKDQSLAIAQRKDPCVLRTVGAKVEGVLARPLRQRSLEMDDGLVRSGMQHPGGQPACRRRSRVTGAAERVPVGGGGCHLVWHGGGGGIGRRTAVSAHKHLSRTSACGVWAGVGVAPSRRARV